MSKTKNDSTIAHNDEYVAHDKEDRSNALILTSKVKKVEKKVDNVEQPTLSKEMLKKIAKLEDKKVRKAERFKSLEIINETTVDDADRVLLTKSAKLGSKMTMKERMAFAFQAGKHNMDVSTKDATRLESKLVDEGDYAAAFEYMDKKAGKTMQSNPFAHMNSSHASLQNIVFDSVSQQPGKRLTRVEISKHVNNMESNLEKDVHFIKQQKRRLRRLENQMIREGTTDVSVLPNSMESIRGMLPGKVVSVKTGINPAMMKPTSTTSAIASVRNEAAGTAALAIAALNKGTVHGKKRKQVIDTLFDMDNAFDDDDDEEGGEKAVNNVVKVPTTTDTEEKMSTHMGMPIIKRTDKATKLSKNIPVAVFGGNDDDDTNNPYALSGFKVLSAKGAVKRAAMAAKLATLDEKSRRRILKQNNRQQYRFMGGSEYELDESDESEEESEEEEKEVRFESWKLVQNMQAQPLKSGRKVLFSANNGPVVSTSKTVVRASNGNSAAMNDNDMNDDDNMNDNDDDDDEEEEEDIDEEAALEHLMGLLGEGDEGDEGDLEMEEDEDMDLVDEDEDDEEMVMYDEEEVPVEEEVLPPRKGVRFDGSCMGFQELLKRVQADLLAPDSDEEKPVAKKTKTIPPVSKSEMTDAPKVAMVKLTPPQQQIKKTIITVNRKPEIENSRLQLPVCGQEQEIMEAVMYNDVVILSGETGSGKTTQVPQFQYESGYALDGFIAVTQPRRVAAMSSAKRVGEELNDQTGLVGYQIRYDSQIGPNTRIKMMTEGVLLREIQFDFLLRKYSVIIIDEAHERGLNTDVLLGLLSRICVLRNKLVSNHGYNSNGNNKSTNSATSNGEIENLSTALDGSLDNSMKHGINTSGVTGGRLKIIIMSATLRTSDFTQNPHLFPIPPPIVAVQSRQYPVSMHFSRITEHDYMQKALQKVIRIHTRLPPGGILVFLTGKKEIELFVKQQSEIFPQPKPGQDNSVDSYVKLGVSNLKTKALRALKQSGQSLNMNDPKVQKMVMEEMRIIKQAAKDKTRTKIMYSKGQPFSVDEIERDEKGITYECVDVEDETKLMDVAKDILEQKVRNVDTEQQVVEDEFELSDDNDYESPVESDEDNDSDDDENSDDENGVSKKYVTDGKNRKVKVKEGETVLDTESKTGTSINDRWLTEQENLKQQQNKPPMLVLPLYALLSPEQQMMVFQHDQYSHGARLVVISTNVAETSVTIPGIKYVVDSGREKRKVYEQTTGSSRFEIGFIAQSSSNQRAGRAGRTGPGHCYRLYSGAVFDEHFDPHTVPEILRQPIESTVLQMKSMGIRDVARFPFPTPPNMRTVQVACHTLYLLNALQQVVEQLNNKKQQEYLRIQKLEESANMGYKSSTKPVVSSGFAIQAPKKAWQLTAEDVEKQQKLKEEQENAKLRAKDEQEKEAAKRAMEARDSAFCVHGQEFVDTTSQNITSTGKAMSVFPLHPRYSKILLSAANQQGCLPLAIIITSALTINELRVKPAILKFHEKEEENDDNDSDKDDDDKDESSNAPFDSSKTSHLTEEEQNKLIRDKIAQEKARMKKEKKEKAKAAKTQQSAHMKALREKWDASCAKWDVEHSDLLTNLRIIGAYLHTRHAYSLKQWKALEAKGVQCRKEKSYDALPMYARPAINKKMNEFCDDNFIRVKAMSEVQQLREQLTHLVRQRIMANTASTTLFNGDQGKVCIGDGDIDELDDADNSVDAWEDGLAQAKMDALHAEIIRSLEQHVVPPPTEEQELALCQIVTTGFLDRVARRMSLETKEQVVKKWKQYSLIPQPRFYPQDVKHKLQSEHISAKDKAEQVRETPLHLNDLEHAYEDQMTGEPLFLSPDSVLGRTDVPLVVYTDMSKDVGRRKKTVISGLTRISQDWLHLLAAPLCAKSRPLEEPMPVFDANADAVRCFVNATLGPNLWELPLVATPFEDETVEEIVSVNGKTQMRRTTRKPFTYYRHLARLILEGSVFPKLRTLRPFYVARPMTIMTTPVPPQAFALIDELTRKKVLGVRDCKRIWYGDGKTKADPNWLCEEVGAWVHGAKKAELKKLWPPIGKFE